MFGKFTGEYYNTLDEKGRIAFPAKIRANVKGDRLWITKGMDGEKSLTIYTPARWEETISELEAKLSIYDKKARMVLRKFVSPAREVVIDKNGRIAIPQNLREYAELKKNCVFLGVTKIIELWDIDIYNRTMLESENVGMSDFS